MRYSETMDNSATPLPADGSIMDPLASVWQSVAENSKILQSLKDYWMLKCVHQQAAEIKVYVKVQPEGTSTLPQDSENKEPKNSFVNLEKSNDVTRFQKAIPTNKRTARGMRDARKVKNPTRVKRKINFSLMIALAMLTLPPVTAGYPDQVQNIKTRINQPVKLPAYAEERDRVTWSLSPESDDDEHFDVYRSPAEIPRKDGCRGYHFEKNHSISIANAKPCHAGTYTLENVSKRSSLTFNLTVDDTVEVTVPKETIDVSAGTGFDLLSTPASPKNSNYASTVVFAVITSIAVLLLGIVIVAACCLNENCRYMRNRTRRVIYKLTNRNEV